MSVHKLSDASRNAAVVVVGNSLYTAIGFICILLVANWLTPAEFGQLSAALALLIVLQEICGSGYDLSVVRFAARHSEEPNTVNNAVYNSALLTKFIVLSLVAGLLYYFSSPLSYLIASNSHLAPTIEIIAFGVVAGGVMTLQLSRYQAEQAFVAFSLLRLANNLFKLALLAFLGKEFLSVESASFAWVLAFVPVLLIDCIVRANLVGKRHKKNVIVSTSRFMKQAQLAKLLKFSGWLILSHLLFALYSRVDVFILGYFADWTAVGVYSVAWNLVYVMDLLTFSIILSLMPKASKLTTKSELVDYSKTSLRISGVVAILFVLILFGSGLFFDIFFSQYDGADEVFMIMFVGPLITLFVHPLYLILYARDKPILVVVSNGTLLVAVALFSVILVPLFGVYGTAVSSVFARAIGCAVILYFVYKEIVCVDANIHRAMQSS